MIFVARFTIACINGLSHMPQYNVLYYEVYCIVILDWKYLVFGTTGS